jgi:hypothetical protein
MNDLLRAEINEAVTFQGSIAEYLSASLNSDPPDRGCRGWEFLKRNITDELRTCLLTSEYWEVKYIDATVEFILKRYPSPALDDQQKQQLGGFVYCWNEKKREAETKTRHNEILAEGYQKITGTEKELDKQKVRGYFNVPKLGILGSFRELEETTGRLFWNEQHKCLMLVPKGRRTRGYLVMDGAFIKKEDGSAVNTPSPPSR